MLSVTMKLPPGSSASDQGPLSRLVMLSIFGASGRLGRFRRVGLAGEGGLRLAGSVAGEAALRQPERRRRQRERQRDVGSPSHARQYCKCGTYGSAAAAIDTLESVA